jgi:hypothetical protein
MPPRTLSIGEKGNSISRRLSFPGKSLPENCVPKFLFTFWRPGIFKVASHTLCLQPHQSYNRLDVVVTTSRFLPCERKAIHCETLLPLAVDLIPQNPRTSESDHSPCIKHQIFTGSRVPSPPFAFLLDTEFSKLSDEDILTAFKDPFNAL